MLNKKSPFIALIIITAIVIVGDIITTELSMRFGATELNPIAQFLLDTHLFTVIKIITLSGLVWGLISSMTLDTTLKIVVIIIVAIVDIVLGFAFISNTIGLILNA